MDMIERVARAIALADMDDETAEVVDLDAHMGFVRPHYTELARAAVEAMRDPTPKMLGAAGKALSPGRRPTEAWVSVNAKHGIRYRAMIDAALSRPTPEHKEE